MVFNFISHNFFGDSQETNDKFLERIQNLITAGETDEGLIAEFEIFFQNGNNPNFRYSRDAYAHSNRPPFKNDTPLSILIRENRFQALQFLASHENTNLNLSGGPENLTPMHYCVAHRKVKPFEAIVKTNTVNAGMLNYVLDNWDSQDENKKYALQSLINHASIDDLEQEGFQIVTPLEKLINQGYHDEARSFISKGADLAEIGKRLASGSRMAVSSRNFCDNNLSADKKKTAAIVQTHENYFNEFLEFAIEAGNKDNWEKFKNEVLLDSQNDRSTYSVSSVLALKCLIPAENYAAIRASFLERTNTLNSAFEEQEKAMDSKISQNFSEKNSDPVQRACYLVQKFQSNRQKEQPSSKIEAPKIEREQRTRDIV